MYKQLKSQIDDKSIIDENIRELEDRIKYKIQKQLGLRGTTFSDIKLQIIGKKDDKFASTFAKIEKLDKELQSLIGEREIINKFINEVYNKINNMDNLELDVFKCRYILGLTQQDTAERIKYSLARVKQVEKEIANKM